MNKNLAIISALLSFLFVFSSPFWTYDYVSQQDDLHHVRFGFPLRYVEQNQNMYTPPFPGTFKMNMIMPQEGPTRIRWMNFFMDIAIVLAIILTVVGLLSHIYKNIKRDRRVQEPKVR